MNQVNSLFDGQHRLTAGLASSWDASFTTGTGWRTCLPHKFNWRHNQAPKSALCPFPCVLHQTDAESHFFPNLKCSSTADQTCFTTPVLPEQLRLDTTVLGQWVQLFLVDQNIKFWGKEALSKTNFRAKRHDHTVQYRIHTVLHHLHYP